MYEISTHTAEVLRQVEGAHLQTNSWVGGDAWFGSVPTCIEVYKRYGAHSTFIVKNNNHLFPMAALNAVLKTRFDLRPAGHWVVFKTLFGDMQVLCLAYAWSQQGVSYFVSSCGKTSPHELKYISNSEDDFGNIYQKEINRPEVAHFLYEYLPLIDEHNKQRQNILNLERCWLTKDPWFCLLTTIVGMYVVDCHRWH
jgi:hypothetical protein